MRPWHTWLAFAFSLALLLAVMGWVSLTVIRLDEESTEARRGAAFEEDIRLALWRLDSVVAPIIGRENVRPAGQYFGDEQPTPLRFSAPRHVRVHFQYHPDGRLTSPQAPDLASGATADGTPPTAAAQLAELGRRISYEALAEALQAGPSLLAAAPPQPPQQKQAQAPNRKLRNPQAQQALNAAEFQARQTVSFSNLWNEEQQQALQPGPQLDLPPGNKALGQAILRPLWFDGALVLARRVVVGGGEYLQGCWIDWAGLSAELTEGVADLLPGASLAPAPLIGQADAVGRRLASLPVMLVPGDPPAEPDAGLSPIQLSLLVAWACLLLAAAAVSVLLRGAVALSERRGAFVSAVTHELRTPLTTMRMYAEMLATGMIDDERKRGEYLDTLHAQSERLAHLVENVLAYSRLERGRSGGPIERVTLPTLLERVRGPLEEQAHQNNLTLEISATEAAGPVAVLVDLSAVERILFNLVDNATKYGASADAPRIWLQADSQNGRLQLRVRDSGPGVPQGAVRRRLFRPFEKSATEAAHSAPGVGLGLALSRRLARQMGGDLILDESVTDGAAFVLILRQA